MKNFIDSFSKRTRVIALFLTGLFNLLYVTSNIISGLFYHNIWYFSLTFLHTVLLSARFYLLYMTGKDKNEEIKSQEIVRRIGYSLILVDTFSLALCFYSILTDSTPSLKSGFIYPILIYGIYSIVVSLYGIFLSVKNKSPVYLAHRNLTLTTALYTIFNFVYSIYLSIEPKSMVAVLTVTFAGAIVFSSSFVLAVLLIKKDVSSNSFTR